MNMTETTITSDKLLITKAKRKAAEWMPFLQSFFGPMRCKATTKVPRASVDQYGRMYYNPDFFNSLGVDTVAYIILHETLHCVLSHCKRTQRMVPDPSKRKYFLANVAQDLCIQQALAKELGGFEPADIIRIDQFQGRPGFAPKRSSEQYYEALLADEKAQANQPQPQPQPGEDEEDESEADDETTDDAEDGDSEGGDQDGEGEESDAGSGSGSGGAKGDSESSDGGDASDLPPYGDICSPEDAGSNSDGVPREWEDEPTLADVSGMEKKLRDVEQVLDDLDPSKGSGAGDIRQALKARLRPLPDPFDQLRHVVGQAVSSPVGIPDLTYRKWPRRTLPGSARLRGIQRLQPTATILLDTSGSMEDCDVKSRALAIVAKGISRLQAPRIVCCDGAIQSAKKVANMQHFVWSGGGGTHMDKGLIEVDKKYRPDTIVIITDGITNWPSQPTRAKVVCALCSPRWAERIPKWIKVVHLYREGNKYVL